MLELFLSFLERFHVASCDFYLGGEVTQFHHFCPSLKPFTIIARNEFFRLSLDTNLNCWSRAILDTNKKYSYCLLFYLLTRISNSMLEYFGFQNTILWNLKFKCSQMYRYRENVALTALLLLCWVTSLYQDSCNPKVYWQLYNPSTAIDLLSVEVE